jgi:hypothetical protein
MDIKLRTTGGNDSTATGQHGSSRNFEVLEVAARVS